LNKLSGESFCLKVYRDEGSSVKITEVDCNSLLPGDVIEIQAKMKIPADCVILEGRVNVDEGMLTGESVPIQK
jgi:P-type E1-E2 ATPase